MNPSASLPSPAQLLVEIVDGVGGRFRGRRLTLDRIGQAIGLTLDEIEVLRRKGSNDVELVASDVEWNGVPITSASVHASNVSFELGATTTLTAEVVDVDGQADPPAAIAWLSSLIGDDWLLDVSQAGLVEARRPGGAFTFLVAAAAQSSAVNVELREIRWRQLRLVVPRWLRLERTRPLPSLPRDIEVVSAGWQDGSVRFRLRVPRLRQPFGLDGLRKAIMGGVSHLSLPSADPEERTPHDGPEKGPGDRLDEDVHEDLDDTLDF
jgi:hypothetical protein